MSAESTWPKKHKRCTRQCKSHHIIRDIFDLKNDFSKLHGPIIFGTKTYFYAVPSQRLQAGIPGHVTAYRDLITDFLVYKH